MNIRFIHYYCSPKYQLLLDALSLKLGCELIKNSDILIFDEPTRGIDVGAKYEIYRLIHEMADQGKAVILVSSELPELLGMSDRIYTICEGSITGVIDSKDADQEKLMRLMTTTADVKS